MVHDVGIVKFFQNFLDISFFFWYYCTIVNFLNIFFKEMEKNIINNLGEIIRASTIFINKN